MKPRYKNIKIKLDQSSITPEDLADLQRWEDEGGHPDNKPDAISSLELPLPLHKKEIFEVIDSEVIIEDGKLYLKADINILSHH
ncbi:hypothetical protein ACG2F4_15145 [Halalkalibaculum sp. DA3122]|uniref:hypothetical protein n=1 Tax=unclassified Halalkalibaculum TaxID=2964617 RepID=UPI0037545AD4